MQTEGGALIFIYIRRLFGKFDCINYLTMS